MQQAVEQQLIQWQDELEKERIALIVNAIEACDSVIAGVTGLAILARSHPRAETYASEIQTKMLGIKAVLEEMTR